MSQQLLGSTVLDRIISLLDSKYKGEVIKFKPAASVVAAEEWDPCRTRYANMYYEQATLLTIGNAELLVAKGDAERYYLIDRIESDLILFMIAERIRKLAWVKKEGIVRKEIANQREFSASVFRVFRDGRLCAGDNLLRNSDEGLCEGLKLVQYIAPNDKFTLGYVHDIVPYLTAMVEKVALKLVTR